MFLDRLSAAKIYFESKAHIRKLFALKQPYITIHKHVRCAPFIPDFVSLARLLKYPSPEGTPTDRPFSLKNKGVSEPLFTERGRKTIDEQPRIRFWSDRRSRYNDRQAP